MRPDQLLPDSSVKVNNFMIKNYRLPHLARLYGRDAAAASSRDASALPDLIAFGNVKSHLSQMDGMPRQSSANRRDCSCHSKTPIRHRAAYPYSGSFGEGSPTARAASTGAAAGWCEKLINSTCPAATTAAFQWCASPSATGWSTNGANDAAATNPWLRRSIACGRSPNLHHDQLERGVGVK